MEHVLTDESMFEEIEAMAVNSWLFSRRSMHDEKAWLAISNQFFGMQRLAGRMFWEKSEELAGDLADLALFRSLEYPRDEITWLEVHK